MDTGAGTPLAVADRLVYAMESKARPQDFVLLLHLHHVPHIAALEMGAQSARNHFPISGSLLQGLRWRWSPQPPHLIATDTGDGALAAFVDDFFDLRRTPPVQQLLLMGRGESRAVLATRVHHAAGDGASAASWLAHQWGVATGQFEPVHSAYGVARLRLRSHPQPARRSAFAFATPPHRIWHHAQAPTRARRWQTLELPADRLQAWCGPASVSYNDLLITILFDVLRRWNRSHGIGHRDQLGLWLPVNIRQRGTSEFGNGSSRIRVYTCYPSALPRQEKCGAVRRQIAWSLRHGEWAVPASHPFLGLPGWLQMPVLRAFLRRPNIDMGSAVFSHVEGWQGIDPLFLSQLARVEVVGQLHEHYAVAFNAVTVGEKTWLTLTHDPALLTAGDLAEMVAMVQAEVEATLAGSVRGRGLRQRVSE